MAAFLALQSVRRKQKQCRQENPLQRAENELLFGCCCYSHCVRSETEVA